MKDMKDMKDLPSELVLQIILKSSSVKDYKNICKISSHIDKICKQNSDYVSRKLLYKLYKYKNVQQPNYLVNFIYNNDKIDIKKYNFLIILLDFHLKDMLENGLKAIYINEDEVSYINDTKYTNSYVYFITDKGGEPFWKKLKSSINEERLKTQIKKVRYEIIDTKRSSQMKKYNQLGRLLKL